MVRQTEDFLRHTVLKVQITFSAHARWRRSKPPQHAKTARAGGPGGPSHACGSPRLASAVRDDSFFLIEITEKNL